MWPLSKSQNSRSHPEWTETTSLYFRRALEKTGMDFDEAQREALGRLYEPSARGFYLWGSVGRGKSMLSELFYDCFDAQAKRRFHFHDFFRELQGQIAATGRSVEKVLESMIGTAQLLFFDEFHVHDVADAIYLTKMLEVLMDREVFLLATSNYAPQELMPDPLFHERFIPAIKLIESRLRVIPLGVGPDYRGRERGKTGSAFGSGSWSIEHARHSGEWSVGLDVRVNGLSVWALDVQDNAVTLTFANLCDAPLSVREYLSLADRFEEFSLVEVPELSSLKSDPLTRFCSVIDVLYERGRRLNVCAVGLPESLLEAQFPPRDAKRTLSRLSMLRRMGAHLD